MDGSLFVRRLHEKLQWQGKSERLARANDSAWASHPLERNGRLFGKAFGADTGQLIEQVADAVGPAAIDGNVLRRGEADTCDRLAGGEFREIVFAIHQREPAGQRARRRLWLVFERGA